MRKNVIAVAALLLSCGLYAEVESKRDSMHVYLDEVVISSAARANEKSAVSYTDVSSEEIERRNIGQELPFLLNLTPSFVATSESGTGVGNTGYRIRGTDANRVNVMVNGIPLNDAESHDVYFVNMPDFASSLSSVQVQRGVGTSAQGAGAFGASINMQTEKLKADPYAEIANTYGSFNTWKSTLKAGTGLMNERWAVDARLSQVLSDGYIDRAGVNMQSYFFSAGYYGENSSLKLVTFGGNQQTNQAWNGVNPDSMLVNRTYNELGEYYDADGKRQFYDNQTDNYVQTHYQLHGLHQFTTDLNLNVSAHYTRGKGYYEDYKVGAKLNEYLIAPVGTGGGTLTRTDLIRQKWLDNHFGGIVWSLNYNQNGIDAVVGGGMNRYSGSHFGKVIWMRDADNLDPNRDWYYNTVLKDDANIYAKGTFEILRGLYLNADMQYRYIHYALDGVGDKFDKSQNKLTDITQQHDFHFLNPKVGLNYAIDSHHAFYTSFSVANREPNRKNYTEAGPNEKPTNETLYDTELGYKYRQSSFSAGVNLFHMQYKNQLILTGKLSEIGAALTTNIPDSYRRGVELMAAAKITTWLKWDTNLALSQHKILNFVEQDIDVYDNATDMNWVGTENLDLGTTQIAMSPNVVANNMFSYHHKEFELSLVSQYVSKQYLDNTSDDGRSIPSYFVNHVYASYSLPLSYIRSLDFGVQINNLLNAQYVSNGYVWYSYLLKDGSRQSELRHFPQAGINFLAMVAVRF